MLSGSLGKLELSYQEDGLSLRGSLFVPVDISNIENYCKFLANLIFANSV